MYRFSTRILTVCALLAFGAFVPLPAQAQNTDKKVAATDTLDIVETAQNTEGFETLVAALKAADLADTLKGEGPFTVFAPTDDAFAALPEGALDNLLKPGNKTDLQSILTYHVVKGQVMARDVVKLAEANTLQESKIGIKTKNGSVMLKGANQATVTQTDIQASNGVIHVIDAVLMPPSERTRKDEK